MNTTQLLQKIRRLWLGPATSILQTDTENLLSHADSVIIEDIYPEILEIFEEYMVSEERHTLSSSQTKYAIPERTYNSMVRKVERRDGATAEAKEVLLINRNQKTEYSHAGYVSAYYMEGDFIVIVGSPSGVLDVAFYMKPSELTASDNWRVIDSVNTGTQTITLTSAPPAAWDTNSLIDVQDAHRSGMLRYWDVSVSAISGSDITFGSEIAGGTFGRITPVAGDYVMLSGYCARPMCPEGLHEAVAHGVCAKIAEALGDGDLFQVADAKFQRSLAKQTRVMDRRVDVQRPLINYKSRFRRWGLGRSWRRFW